MKHTKGPWTVQDTDIFGPDGNYPIAQQVDDTNAQLIASAPELLEALEEILAEVANGHNKETVGMEWARHAIAKARGGSNG